MKFVPLTPPALVGRLARWIDRQGPGRLRIGFDGPSVVGTTALADEVGQALEKRNRQVIRISTDYWWRAASLRLEYGRQDIESRLTGWVDVASLTREAFGPLAPEGSGRYLTQLRDPLRDRAIRQQYGHAGEGSVLVVDGPMLASHGLTWDGFIRVGVSAGALERALPPDSQWELLAYHEYRRRWPPSERAEVVISYDHPQSPAVAGL